MGSPDGHDAPECIDSPYPRDRRPPTAPVDWQRVGMACLFWIFTVLISWLLVRIWLLGAIALCVCFFWGGIFAAKAFRSAWLKILAFLIYCGSLFFILMEISPSWNR